MHPLHRLHPPAPDADLTKPLYLTFDQVNGRTAVSAFTDLAEAKAYASGKAKRTGRKVAVFGPQSNVYAPPPKVEAQEVQLDFGA